MAYDGERLLRCFAIPFQWHHTSVVVVSGDRWNICGHALLNTGNRSGHYFHVAGPYSHPLYMNEQQYQRYLRENGKRELKRQRVLIKRPRDAEAKLYALTSEKWLWLILPNNCASFVEEIIAAGGAPIANLWNCPAKWHWF